MPSDKLAILTAGHIACHFAGLHEMIYADNDIDVALVFMPDLEDTRGVSYQNSVFLSNFDGLRTLSLEEFEDDGEDQEIGEDTINLKNDEESEGKIRESQLSNVTNESLPVYKIGSTTGFTIGKSPDFLYKDVKFEKTLKQFSNPRVFTVVEWVSEIFARNGDCGFIYFQTENNKFSPLAIHVFSCFSDGKKCSLGIHLENVKFTGYDVQFEIETVPEETLEETFTEVTDDDFVEDFDENEEELPYHWLEGDSLAPPCQTDYGVVRKILDLMQPFATEHSKLYDLGCGDGRICLSATRKYHCYSVGVEIEPLLISKLQKKTAESSLFQSKIQAINDSLLNVPFSDDANIIVIYLLPEAIELIRDKLITALQRDCVIICNSWGIKSLVPQQIVECGFANNVKLFLYTKDCLLPE